MDAETKKRLLTLHDDSIQNMELRRAAAGPLTPPPQRGGGGGGEDSAAGAASGRGGGAGSASPNRVAKAAKAGRRAPVIAPISPQEVASLTSNVIGPYSSYEIQRIIQLQRYYDSYSYEPKVSDGGRLPDDGSDPLYQIQSNMTTIARILSAQLEEDAYWDEVKREAKEEEDRERGARDASKGVDAAAAGAASSPDSPTSASAAADGAAGSPRRYARGYMYPEEDEEADEFIDDEELFSEGAVGGQRLRARVAKLRDQIYNSSILMGEKDIMFQIFRFAKIFQTPNVLQTPLASFLGILTPHARSYEKEDPNPYIEAYGRPSLQIRLLTALLRFRRDETNALKRVVKALMEKLSMAEVEIREVAERTAAEGASEISRLRARVELLEREQKFLYYRVYGGEGVEYFASQLADGTFAATASAEAAAALSASRAVVEGGNGSGSPSLSGTASAGALSPLLATSAASLQLGATATATAAAAATQSTTGLSGAMLKAGGLKALAAESSKDKPLSKEQAAIHKQNKYRKEVDECYIALRDAEVSRAVARVKGAKGQAEHYISKLEAHLDQQQEMTTEATLFALKAADSRARAVEKLRFMEQRMMEMHDTMPLGRLAPVKQSLRRAEKDAQRLFFEISPGKYESHATMRELPGFLTGSFAGTAASAIVAKAAAANPKTNRYNKFSSPSNGGAPSFAEIPTIPILNHIGRNNIRIIDVSEAIVKEAVPYLESQVKSIISKIEAHSRSAKDPSSPSPSKDGGNAVSDAAKRLADKRRSTMLTASSPTSSGPQQEELPTEYTPSAAYKHEKTVALLRHVTGAAELVRQSLCTITTMVLTAAATNGVSAGQRHKPTGHYSQEGGPPTPNAPESTVRAIAEAEAAALAAAIAAAGGPPPGAAAEADAEAKDAENNKEGGEGEEGGENAEGGEGAANEESYDEHGNLLNADGTIADPEKRRHAGIISTITARRALVGAASGATNFRGAAIAMRNAKANNKARRLGGGAAAARERELKSQLHQYDPNDPLSLPPKNPALGPTDLLGDNVHFVGAAAQLLHHEGFLQRIIDSLLVGYMRATEAERFMDPYGLLTTGYRLDSETNRKRRTSIAPSSGADGEAPFSPSGPGVGHSPTRRGSRGGSIGSPTKGGGKRQSSSMSLSVVATAAELPPPPVETAEVGVQAILVTTEELNAELNNAINLRDTYSKSSIFSATTGGGRPSAADEAFALRASLLQQRSDAGDGEEDAEADDDDPFDEDGAGIGGDDDNEDVYANGGRKKRPASSGSVTFAPSVAIGGPSALLRGGSGGSSRRQNSTVSSTGTVVTHDLEDAHSDNGGDDSASNDSDDAHDAMGSEHRQSEHGGDEGDGDEGFDDAEDGSDEDHDGHLVKYGDRSSSPRPASNGSAAGRPPKPSPKGRVGAKSPSPPGVSKTKTTTPAGKRATGSGYGAVNKHQTATGTGAAGRPRDPVSGALLHARSTGGGGLVGGTGISIGTNTKPPKSRNAYCQVALVPIVTVGGNGGNGAAAADGSLGIAMASQQPQQSPYGGGDAQQLAAASRRLAALPSDVDAALLALSRHSADRRREEEEANAAANTLARSSSTLGMQRRRSLSFNGGSSSPRGGGGGASSSSANLLQLKGITSSADGLVKSPRLCPVAVPTNPFEAASAAPLPPLSSAPATEAGDKGKSLITATVPANPIVMDVTMVVQFGGYGDLLASCPAETVEATEMLRHLINDELRRLNAEISSTVRPSVQQSQQQSEKKESTAAADEEPQPALLRRKSTSRVLSSRSTSPNNTNANNGPSTAADGASSSSSYLRSNGPSAMASVVRCEADCVTIRLRHPSAPALMAALAMRIERKAAQLPYADALLVHPAAAAVTAAEATPTDAFALRLLATRRAAAEAEAERAGFVELSAPILVADDEGSSDDDEGSASDAEAKNKSDAVLESSVKSTGHKPQQQQKQSAVASSIASQPRLFTPAAFYACRGPRLVFSLAAAAAPTEAGSASTSSAAASPQLPNSAELAAVEALGRALGDPMEPPPERTAANDEESGGATSIGVGTSTSTAHSSKQKKANTQQHIATAVLQGNASILIDAATLRSLAADLKNSSIGNNAANNTNTNNKTKGLSTQCTAAQLLIAEYGAAAFASGGISAFAAAYPTATATTAASSSALLPYSAANANNTSKTSSPIIASLSVTAAPRPSHYFLDTPAAALRERFYATLRLRREGYTFATVADGTSDAKAFSSYAAHVRVSRSGKALTTGNGSPQQQQQQQKVSPNAVDGDGEDAFLSAAAASGDAAADDAARAATTAELPSPFADPSFKALLLSSGPAAAALQQHSAAAGGAGVGVGSAGTPFSAFASAVSNLQWQQDAVRRPSEAVCGQPMAFVAIEVRSLRHYMSFDQFVDARRALALQPNHSNNGRRPSASNNNTNGADATSSSSSSFDLLSDEEAYDLLLAEASEARARLITLIDQTAAAMASQTTAASSLSHSPHHNAHHPGCYRCSNWSTTHRRVAAYLEANKAGSAMHYGLKEALYGGQGGGDVDAADSPNSPTTADGRKKQRTASLQQRGASAGSDGRPPSNPSRSAGGRVGSGAAGRTGSAATAVAGTSGASRPTTGGRPPSSSSATGGASGQRPLLAPSLGAGKGHPNATNGGDAEGSSETKTSSKKKRVFARHRPFRHCPPTVLVYACADADSAVALAAAAHLNALHTTLSKRIVDYFPSLGPQHERSQAQQQPANSWDAPVGPGALLWRGVPVRAVVGMATPSFAVVGADQVGDGLIYAHDVGMFSHGHTRRADFASGGYGISDDDDEDDNASSQHKGSEDGDGAASGCDSGSDAYSGDSGGSSDDSGEAENEKDAAVESASNKAGTSLTSRPLSRQSAATGGAATPAASTSPTTTHLTAPTATDGKEKTKKKKRKKRRHAAPPPFRPHIYAAPMPTMEVFGEEVAMALSGLSAARFGETLVTEAARANAAASTRRRQATIVAAGEALRPTAQTMANYMTTMNGDVDGTENDPFFNTGGGSNHHHQQQAHSAAPNTANSPPFIASCMLIPLPAPAAIPSLNANTAKQQPVVRSRALRNGGNGGGDFLDTINYFDFRTSDPASALFICHPRSLQGRYNFLAKMAGGGGAAASSAKRALATAPPLPVMGLPLLIRSWDRSVPMLQHEGELQLMLLGGGGGSADDGGGVYFPLANTTKGGRNGANGGGSSSTDMLFFDAMNAAMGTAGIPIARHDLSLAAAFRHPLAIAEALSRAEAAAASLLHRDYQRLLGVTDVRVDGGTLEMLCSHDDDGLLPPSDPFRGGGGEDGEEEDSDGNDESGAEEEAPKTATRVQKKTDADGTTQLPTSASAAVGPPQLAALMASLNYSAGLALTSGGGGGATSDTVVDPASVVRAAKYGAAHLSSGFGSATESALSTSPYSQSQQQQISAAAAPISFAARAAAFARRYHPAVIPSLKLLTSYNAAAGFVHRQAALSPAIAVNARRAAALLTSSNSSAHHTYTAAAEFASSGAIGAANAAVVVIELFKWPALIRSLLEPFLPLGAGGHGGGGAVSGAQTRFQRRQNEEKATCIVAAASAITTSLRSLVQRHLDAFDGVEVSASRHFAPVASLVPLRVGGGSLESAASRGLALFPYWSPAHCGGRAPPAATSLSSAGMMASQTQNRSASVIAAASSSSSVSPHYSSAAAAAFHTTAHITVAFADPIKAALCVAHLQAALEDFSPTTNPTIARDMLNASARSAATAGGVGVTTGNSGGGGSSASAGANGAANNSDASTATSASASASPKSSGGGGGQIMSDGASEDEHVMRAVSAVMAAYNGLGGGIDGRAAGPSANGRGLKVRCALHYGQLRCRDALAVSVRAAMGAELKQRQRGALEARAQQLSKALASATTAATGGATASAEAQRTALAQQQTLLEAQQRAVDGAAAAFGYAERHALLATSSPFEDVAGGGSGGSSGASQEAMRFYGDALPEVYETLLLGPRRLGSSSASEEDATTAPVANEGNSDDGNAADGGAAGFAASVAFDDVAFLGGESIATPAFMAALAAHPALFVESAAVAMANAEKAPSTTAAVASAPSGATTNTTSDSSAQQQKALLVPNTFDVSVANDLRQRLGRALTAYTSTLDESAKRRTFARVPLLPLIPTADNIGASSTVGGAEGSPSAAATAAGTSPSSPAAAAPIAPPAVVYLLPAALNSRVRALGALSRDLMRLSAAASTAIVAAPRSNSIIIVDGGGAAANVAPSSWCGYERLVCDLITAQRRAALYPFEGAAGGGAGALSALGSSLNRPSAHVGSTSSNAAFGGGAGGGASAPNALLLRRFPFAAVCVRDGTEAALEASEAAIASAAAAAAEETSNETSRSGKTNKKRSSSLALPSPAAVSLALLRQHVAVVAAGLAAPPLSYATMAALYQSWLSTAGADIAFAVEAQLEAETMRAEAAQQMAGAIDAEGGAGVGRLHSSSGGGVNGLLVPSGGLSSHIPQLLRIGGAGASSLLRRPQHSFGGRDWPLKSVETILMAIGGGVGAVGGIGGGGSRATSPAAATRLFMQQTTTGRLGTAGGGGGGGAAAAGGGKAAWAGQLLGASLSLRGGGGRVGSMQLGASGRRPSGGAASSVSALGGRATGGAIGASDLMLAAALQQLFRYACAVSAKAARVMGYPQLSLATNPNQYDSRLRDAIALVRSGGGGPKGSSSAAAGGGTIDLNTFHTSALDVAEHAKTVVQATMTALQCRTDKQSFFHRTTQTMIAIPPTDVGPEADAAVYARVKDTEADGGEVFVRSGTAEGRSRGGAADASTVVGNSSAAAGANSSGLPLNPRENAGGGYALDANGRRHGLTGHGPHATNAYADDDFAPDERGLPLLPTGASGGANANASEAMHHAMRRGYRPGGDQDIAALRLRERRLMALEEALERVATAQEGMQRQLTHQQQQQQQQGGGGGGGLLAPISLSSLGGGGGGTASQEEAAAAMARNYFGALTVFNRPAASPLLPPIPNGGAVGRKQQQQQQQGQGQLQVVNFAGHPVPPPQSRNGASLSSPLPPIHYNANASSTSTSGMRSRGGPAGGTLHTSGGLLQPMMGATPPLPMKGNDPTVKDFTADAGFVTISRLDHSRDLRGDLASPFQAAPQQQGGLGLGGGGGPQQHRYNPPTHYGTNSGASIVRSRLIGASQQQHRSATPTPTPANNANSTTKRQQVESAPSALLVHDSSGYEALAPPAEDDGHQLAFGDEEQQSTPQQQARPQRVGGGGAAGGGAQQQQGARSVLGAAKGAAKSAAGAAKQRAQPQPAGDPDIE